MNIKSLSAKGFKNLSFDNLSLPNVTLVLGENGVGKSNLLQLVHCLFQPKEAFRTEDLQFDLDGSLPDDDLVCRNETEGTATVVLSSDLPLFGKMKEALGPSVKSAKEATLDFRFWRESGTSFKVTGIRVGSAQIYGAAEVDPKIQDSALPAVHAWLAEEVRGCTVYVPINRLLARHLVPYTAEPAIDAVSDLENKILRLLTDPSQNADLIDQLKKSMADFFGVEELRNSLVNRPEPANEPRKSREHGYREELGRPISDIGVGIRIRERNKEWFDIQRVGSGLQQLLVILTMLYERKASIALVEEFDSSLSPKLRSDLLKHFIGITGGEGSPSQLIATTHASFEWPPTKPHCIGAKPGKDGKVGFEPVNDHYLKRHTMPPVIA